jgi:methanethiol S-methyltransferase
MTRFERLFVWLGGAAFIASLAVCLAAFGISWSDTHDLERYDGAMAAWAIAIDVGLFVLFAAHHSLFARDAIKTWLMRRVPDRLLRSVYVWIASALLILVIVLWQPIGGLVYEHTGWKAGAHMAVQLAGLWLVTQSVRAIDPLELAGIRASTAPTPGRAGASDGLQIAGPYQLVRHPLYLGWMLMVLGAARMTGDRLLFAAITSTYLLLAVPWEERSLERTFGEAYHRYKRQVRWRVLPYVY